MTGSPSVSYQRGDGRVLGGQWEEGGVLFFFFYLPSEVL